MNGRPDPSQTIQRIKVGMIGLVAVVLLIAIASAILGSATRNEPATGSAQANLAAGNAAAPAAGEPLAEMGVAPSANTQDAAAPAR